jgi:prepilin-type processing-associated H-X9-DG protein
MRGVFRGTAADGQEIMSLSTGQKYQRDVFAFTLVELLVVIGIIAMLIAMLMPMLADVRARARSTACASNVRNLCTALIAYSSENRWRFPPTLSAPSPGQYWYDADRIGSFLGGANPYTTHPSVFSCSEDDNGWLSYAMNIWASSAVDPSVLAWAPARSSLWSATVRRASQILLVTESWSGWGSNTSGWFASPAVGFEGDTPEHRFGADGGLSPPVFSGRWGMVNCEIAYMRHRDRGAAAVGTQPKGSVNIGYADGHVALQRNGDLVNYTSGTVTGDCYWSPIEMP